MTRRGMASACVAAACAVAVAAGVMALAVAPAAAGAGGRAAYPPIPAGAVKRPSGCGTSPPPADTVPAGDLATLRQEVVAFAGSHVAGIGQCGPGTLELTLTDGSETTARAVRARFGPAVQIMVGMTVWNGHPGVSPRCGSLPTGAKWPAGVTATLRFGRTSVASGSTLTGTVVLHDRGPTRMTVEPGQPLLAVLLRPGTRRVVGVYDMVVAGVGSGTTLRTGASWSDPVLLGTARCDGGVGSALPPGRYTAIAEVTGPTARSGPVRFTDEVAVRVRRSSG